MFLTLLQAEGRYTQRESLMSKQDQNGSNNEEIDIDAEALSFVSQQYQSSRLSEPSLAIDSAILQQAKAELSVQTTPKKRGQLRSLRTWQFGGSIAASILIVVLVFSFVHQPSEQAFNEYTQIMSTPSPSSAKIESPTEIENDTEEPSKRSIFDMSQLSKEADQNARARQASADLSDTPNLPTLQNEHKQNQLDVQSNLAQQMKRLNIAGARHLQADTSDLLAQLVNIQTQFDVTHEQIMSMTFDQPEIAKGNAYKANIETYKQVQALLLQTLSESKENNNKTSFDEQFKAVMSAEQWQTLNEEPKLE